MQELLTKTKNILLSGTIVVGVGVLISSFFSYLLQFFLARFLSVADYGTFNVLLSLTSITGLPAIIFGTPLIKLSSELAPKNQFKKLTALFWSMTLYASLLGSLIFVTLLAFRFSLASFLNISNPELFIFLGLFIAVSYLGISPSSFLQGLLRFKSFAFYTSLSGFLRFLFPALAVLAGFGVGGVMMGLFTTGLASFLISVMLLLKNFEKTYSDDLSDSYKKLLGFSVPVLFVSFGLMALNNLDLILVKKYFDEVSAGHYAGVVTLGKILLFGAGIVTTVMFPRVVAAFSSGKSYTLLFKKMFLLQSGVVALGLFSFFFFPKLITHIFFGKSFDVSSQYLPSFSIFIGLYVLINFLILFFLAIEQTRVVFFLILAVVIQYLLINSFHTSLWQVITINISVTSALLGSILIYLYLGRKKYFK